MIEDVITEVLGGLGAPKEGEFGVSELAGCGYRAHLNRSKRVVTDAMLEGVAIHEAILRKLAEALTQRGYEVYREYRVTTYCGDKRVAGYVDLYISSPRVVIELKSAVNIWNNPFEPWYIRQVAMYSHMTNAEYGLLVYIKSDAVGQYVIKRVSEKLDPCTRIDVFGMRERGPWCSSCMYRRICLNQPLS